DFIHLILWPTIPTAESSRKRFRQTRGSTVGSAESSPVSGLRENCARLAAQKPDHAEKLPIVPSASLHRRKVEDLGYGPARNITSAQMIGGGPGMRMHDSDRWLVH